MNMDRNTILGFVILAVLMGGYFWFNRQGQQSFEQKQKIEKARQDSIANANKPKTDTIQVKRDSLKSDSLRAGNFTAAVNGTEQRVTMENEVMRIEFTNKGAQPAVVELKNFKSTNGKPVRMADVATDRISYNINTAPNQAAPSASLFFSGGEVKKNADGSQTVTYQLASSDGKSIAHQYTIYPNNYLLDFNVQMTGADQLLTGGSLNLNWQVQTAQHEKDLKYEQQQSQALWIQNGDYDYEALMGGASVKFEKPTNWLALKQQFFNATLVAKNNFASGELTVTSNPDTTKHTVMSSVANMKVMVPAGTNTVGFHLYYGPNDYKILKAGKLGMENIVNLGQGMFSFVKYLNRWIVIPVFDFFRKYVGEMGIVILLLTFVIRLIIAPLTYSSYLSGAKMKVLRPELDVLKKKHGSDQQAYSMEQMKLFRSAGVNPLGGCIPALLQIPIFFALFSFFNSSIALRGQDFLWATDLSAYDTIAKLPFNIPFYGNHVSLFTITATITSFLISWYNMSMTPDQSNPVLKYMPYIFPIFLIFIFNSMPSALTWYYTVSNVITLLLQFVIQKYIINHDKILAQMEENKKKPKAKSKWQEKLEQMQETQKRVQEMKQKTQKK
jgi:YidC/Oxa1 family membrane protein insertase